MTTRSLTTRTTAEVSVQPGLTHAQAKFNLGSRGMVIINVCELFGLDVDQDAERVARAQISNERLLKMGEANRPPQSWYDRDEEDLF